MKKIYANLLGEWVELQDTDTIQNENPYIWIREHNLHEHNFINVSSGEKGYKIHVSQIQISNE
ncbi:hypothetical protein P4G96_10595 [Bacillus cereus]|nr:hypothetical protein [Bacillus cereus]MEB8666272.1 hypothetical protein [Bacillus cereus]